MLLPACLWQCCRKHLIKQNYDLVAGPSNMRPRRAQFRGEKLPAYNAPSDDWGLVCARSRLDPLFGLCVCEVRTPRPMGARHTWGRDVRVASPVNRDHTREHERKSEFCFEVGNETRNPVVETEPASAAHRFTKYKFDRVKTSQQWDVDQVV